MQPPAVRTGQGDVKLSRAEFERRIRERFADPAFDAVAPELRHIVDVAWTAHDKCHKSPRTRKAGPGFADPAVELPMGCRAAHKRLPGARREPAGTLGTSRSPCARTAATRIRSRRAVRTPRRRKSSS